MTQHSRNNSFGWIRLPQSISFRLLTLILITELLIIGVLGSFNSHIMQQQIERDIYQRLVSINQLATNETQVWLTRPLQQLSFVAGVLSQFHDDDQLIEVLMNQLMGEKQAVDEVALYSSQGELLLEFSHLGLGDADRKGKKTMPEEVRKALTGHQSVGAVHFSKYGLPEIDMAVPVLDVKTNLQGVLFAHVLLQDIAQYLEQFNLNHTSSVLVFDRSGRLIAHSDGSFVRQGVYLSDQPFAHVQASSATELLSYQNLLKQQVFAVAQRDLKTGWTVVVEQMESVAMAPLDQTKMSRLIALGAVVAITLILGLYILQLITRPLAKLGQAVEQISAGDLEVELEVPKGGGEVAKFSRAFIKMAGHIYQQRHALEQEKARIQLLLESIGEGLLGIDINGHCTFINPAGIKMLGYEDDKEILGKNSHQLIHHSHANGDAYSQDECPIYRTLRTGQIASQDSEVFWRKDGSALAVKYQAHPTHKGGQIVGVICSFMDMTQTRKDELRLKQLALAVEQSPATVIITDADGNIEYGNQKLLDLTGYEMHEVIGQNPRMFSAGETPLEVYESLWTAITNGQEWHGILQNKKKDGSVFTEEMWVSVITNNAGKVTNFVAVKEDITERHLMEQKIWKQAHYDGLTQLPNRMLFDDRLKHSIFQAKRNKCELALLYIDLDGFKQINDNMSHQAGDELLKIVAARLLECVRETDTVGRLGGDEFAVVLSDFDNRSHIDQVAQRIISACRDPFELTAGTAKVSCSIGVSRYPQDGEDEEVLQTRADIAMYRIKRMHKDGISYFSA